MESIFNADITVCLKVKLYNQCELPVLTYNVETSIFTRSTRDKIQLVQRAMERSMLGITRRDTVRNNITRKRTDVKREEIEKTPYKIVR